MPKPPLVLCVPCKIEKIHDGDTATKATITLDIQIRYLDCWAPELSEKGGPEARDAAKAAEGKMGRLLIPLDKANNISDLLTFGRVLGTFYPDGQEESESERLCRLGYATPTKPKPNPTKQLSKLPPWMRWNEDTQEWDYNESDLNKSFSPTPVKPGPYLAPDDFHKCYLEQRDKF
jgi:endonuclease YncB( thermonuclease family)